LRLSLPLSADLRLISDDGIFAVFANFFLSEHKNLGIH